KRGDSAKFYGDDVGALLAYATACELAIVNLTLALAWEDGVRAEDAARTYRDMSVTKMLTSLCHPLGGTWSVDKPGFSRDWRVHVAEVRNRIISYRIPADTNRCGASAPCTRGPHVDDPQAIGRE